MTAREDDTTTPALELALAELADSMTPHPSEFMADYSPGAALLFLRQVAEQMLGILAGAAASVMAEPDEEQPVLSEALNGVAACLAGSTHALVALGVLPVEAEDALVAKPGA